MPGPKTHEQQIRMFERKDDLPPENPVVDAGANATQAPTHPEARQSELPVSRHGMNQASRHDKHNDPEEGA